MRSVTSGLSCAKARLPDRPVDAAAPMARPALRNCRLDALVVFIMSPVVLCGAALSLFIHYLRLMLILIFPKTRCCAGQYLSCALPFNFSQMVFRACRQRRDSVSKQGPRRHRLLAHRD